MQVSLVFPPSWMPSQPFLSLPSLQGFLKNMGVENISIRDLNIETMDALLSSEKVKKTHATIVERLNKGKESIDSEENPEEVHSRLSWAREVIEKENMVQNVEWAKSILKSQSFYEIDDYIESWQIIDRWLQAFGLLYYPSEISIADNSMRYSVYSSEDVLKAVNNKHENPYHDLFNEHIIDSMMLEDPDLVGISVTATSQIMPAFTLARKLKEEKRDLHITMGGSVFTKLIDNLQQNHLLFDLVDSFIVFEGEHALLGLIEQLEGKKDFSKVPNLVYKEGSRIRVNQPFHIEDINSLPTPDYDGFPLDLYLSPKRVLPLQGSRGCYWRKCTFCNLHVDNLKFRLRNLDLVLEDMDRLKAKYGAKYMFFSDECMPVKQLESLSSRLIEKGNDVKWMAGVRFDKGLTKDILSKAREAGCLKMVFGLESSNKRILSLMDKGIETEITKNIIDDCGKTGIAIHMYVIIGFPSETREEALETLDFVISNEKFLKTKGASCLACLFELEKHAPILRDPGKYGLTKIGHPKQDDLSLGYFYETDRGMTLEESGEVYEYVRSEIDKRLSIFPYNFSMSDGLLYLDNCPDETVESTLSVTQSEIT
ncbi:MAG: B12-binding domain-containing radical SAM protein [Candidatus Scalindua sp.]|nr:B12-binding domain-containing radical SAM protein [Candidatus Scalindua sp.]MCR4343931.1 B12-binding domain-containing radical SAM protein [Candidatus Scalindua sp.]